MRSNQPQARGRSALSLTRNFKASNADSHTKSAIRGGPRREARTQRFGNKWKRTRSRSDRWHITTERTGNITGAWFRAGAAARARSGGGRSGVRAHSVLAASRSRLEWVQPPLQTRRRRACGPSRLRPRPAPPTRLPAGCSPSVPNRSATLRHFPFSPATKCLRGQHALTRLFFTPYFIFHTS